MEPIQVLAIVFAVFLLSRVFLRFQDGKITNIDLILWSIISIVLLVVALAPQLTGWLSGLFGVNRPIDLAVYLSVILLFYLVFQLYVKFEETEKNVTEIVRLVAINNAKKGKKK